MQDAKPNATSMATGNTLPKFDGVAFENPQLYRSIVGALQYVTISRIFLLLLIEFHSICMHQPLTIRLLSNGFSDTSKAPSILASQSLPHHLLNNCIFRHRLSRMP
jgi:hypothetical protein